MKGQKEKIRRNENYFLAVILGWALPGAGHWILGQRKQAVILGALLLGTFWWGETIAEGYAVTRKEHEYFFYGQAGIGVSAFIANQVQSNKLPAVITQEIDREVPVDLQTGILLTSISGILNIILVLYVMDPRSWERREERRRTR